LLQRAIAAAIADTAADGGISQRLDPLPVGAAVLV